MSAKKTGPTATDLMKVLRECEQYDTPKIIALTRREEAARHALSEFIRTSKEYQRLDRAREKAYESRYAAEQQHRDSLRKRVRACRNQIRLHGVTATSIEMVEALVNESQAV